MNHLQHIKQVLAEAIGTPGVTPSEINVAVINIIDSGNQRSQLAFGGNINGDNEFVCATTRNSQPDNVFYPSGTQSNGQWKINSGGVIRTLNHQNWWGDIMEMNDYIYQPLTTDQVSQITDDLNAMAGQSLTFLEISD